MTDKDPKVEETKNQTDPEEEELAGDDSDRRKHPRVKAKLHMVYEDGRTSFKTRVIDISLGGVFLEMEKPPEAGTEIRLTPVLPDQGPNDPATQIRGRVVRVVEYDLENFPHPRTGIGVEFSDVSEGEQSLLSNIFREGLRELKEDEVVDEDDSSRTGEWRQISEEELEKVPPGGKS